MDGGALLLVVMTVGAALLLVVVGWLAFQRFAGPPGSALVTAVPCGYRGTGAGSATAADPADAVQRPWRRGVARFDDTTLTLYAGGSRGAPVLGRWPRTTLDLGQAWTVDPALLPGLPPLAEPEVIVCLLGDGELELAMGRGHYTAVRSWHEAAPPGWNTNVA